jgi:villin 1/advillin
VDAPKAVPKLVELSDSSGSLQTRVVAEGKLEYKDLNENEVFIVDTVQSLFVWIGGKASKEERRNGMKHGVQYASDNGYGVGCAIQVQKQGSETTIFKGYFKGWPDARKAKNSDDVSALYAAKAAQEEEMLGNMNGTIKNIWRIKDMKKEDLEKKFWGQFWAGDCFIVLYSYPITPSKEGHIIYFWQGRDSSVDEKGASALLAKELDDEMGGDPVQCRVPMGKERKDFLSMFKGKMIVHEGGVASGFKNRADEDSFDTDGISLFHVRGSNEYNTRAVQVGEVAASLNSGDCFVLLTPNSMYVWKGKGSNAQEQKTAADIADTIKGNRSTTAVEEGSEPDEFWAAIGGKGEYPSSSQSDDEEVEPRLFLIQHMGSDGLRVEEVPNYDQSDLQNDDVMMLDVKSEVFLWIGAVSQREEKDAAMQVALDYVKNAPDGRDPDTPVYRISAGYEPPQFTQHFLGWDASKSSSMDEDPYLKLMAAMGKSTGGGLVAVSADTIGFAKPGAQSFTLAELQGPAPPGVDPARKEIYLSDADFQSLFGMDKDAWEKLPKWKREGAKKKNKLF